MKLNAAADKGADIIWSLFCRDKDGEVQTLEMACNKDAAAALLTSMSVMRFLQENMINGFIATMRRLEALGVFEDEEAAKANERIVETFSLFQESIEERNKEFNSILGL